MERHGSLLGAAIAAAVGLALQGCATSGSPASTTAIMQTSPQVGNHILCYGVNSCRGQSACMMTTTGCGYVNRCAGKNSCKGQGGTNMTIAECEAAGGRVPLVPAPDDGISGH